MTTPEAAAPATASITRRYGWNVASGITLFGGGILTVVVAIFVAVLEVMSNPITGDQYGWNVLGVIVIAFTVAVSGFGGIPALVAAALAAIGLVRHGRSVAGILLLVISALLSLQLLSIPGFVACYPVCY